MGAFNEWAKDSPLEPPANRTVVGVAFNLLYGACIVLRRAALRQRPACRDYPFFAEVIGGECDAFLRRRSGRSRTSP